MLLCQIEGHTFLAQELSPESTVIDLGANIGAFSRKVVDQFHCRCYAFEANSELCSRIEPCPQLTVLNLAVAARSGTAALHISDNPEASTILSAVAAGVRDTITVPAVSLEQFCQSMKFESVDLIKFDIEGAEIDVIDACSDQFLTCVSQFTIEFHDFLGITPVATVARVVQRLQGLGFFHIKMWRYAYGDTLFINRRLISASLLDCLWARYVTRNWWGLQRVLSRTTARTSA